MRKWDSGTKTLVMVKSETRALFMGTRGSSGAVRR
jgi:hypothetical protein